MKIIKIVLSVITILFAALGLLRVLSFDIANPVMLTALAAFLLLQSIEYQKDRKKADFILTIAAALFVLAVVVYNVFLA